MVWQLLIIKGLGMYRYPLYAPLMGLDTIHGPKAKNGSAALRQILDIQLFRWSPLISDEFGHETCSIGNFISLPSHVVQEWPNWILYASCTLLWRWGGHGLRVGLEVKIWNSELDWISTSMCASPCLSSALLMSHLSSSSPPWFLTIIKSLGSNWFSK
jgi:hypothetical protein